MKGLNKEIKVTKLAEVLDARLLDAKRGLKALEKDMRINKGAMNDTPQFLYTENEKKVNPSYQKLVEEQMKIRDDIATLREKRVMFEEALKRYDLIEQKRDGKKYLEDAVIEVSLSQMTKWGIKEADVE